jgi:hypothetical protein
MFFILGTVTVMLVQPTQLPGHQSNPSAGATPAFEFRAQYCDSLDNFSLHLFLHTTE